MSSYHDGFPFGFLSGGSSGGAASMSNATSTGGGGGGGGANNSSSHGSTSSSLLGSAGSGSIPLSLPPSHPQQQPQLHHQQQQLASSFLQSSSLNPHASQQQQQQQQQLQYQHSLLQQLQLQLAGAGGSVSSIANPGTSSATGGGGGAGGARAGSNIQQHQQQQLSSYAAAMMEHLLAQTGATTGQGVGATSSALSATATESQHLQPQHLLSLHGLGASGLGFAGAVTSSAGAPHDDVSSATMAALVHSSSDGTGQAHRNPTSTGRGSTSSPLTTASGSGKKQGKASVLLDYTRDNPPNPALLFVPKGTRQASVWSHMRLISTPESVAKTKRSGRDAVGLWCTVCQRVVHHGWTSGETNPVKRHCTEKRHVAVLSAMRKRGDPGTGTGQSGAAPTDRKASRMAGSSGGGGGHRKGEGGAKSDNKATEHRRRQDVPPLAPTSSGAAARESPIRRERVTDLPPPPAKRFKGPPGGGMPRPSVDGATSTSANALVMAETKHRNDVQAYSTALVRSLLYSKVQMIRYIATDVSNRTRTKTTPLRVTNTSSLADPIALPASTVGKGDAAVMESAILTPDWSTMRIPPYSPDTALVVGNLSYPQRPADQCSRTVLQSVVDGSTTAGLSVLASVVLNVGVKLSNTTAAAPASPQPVEGGQDASEGGIVDSGLSPVDCLITLLLGQIQLQEIGVDSISEVDDSLQLELSLHENPVTLVDNVVIVRENLLHLARQHGLQLDFQSDHDVHFHLNLVDSETGQNLFLRNSGSSQARRGSSFVSQHDISGQGQSFLEGVLNHLPALVALTRPTDAGKPASASWDMEGSSSEAPLRVTFQGLDYRPCSWSANLYLALSGILTAGMDGMAKNLVLRPPASGIQSDDEHSDRAPEKEIATLPKSFQESLQALKEDDLLAASLPTHLMDRYMSLYYRAASNELTRSIAHMSQGSTPP